MGVTADTEMKVPFWFDFYSPLSSRFLMLVVHGDSAACEPCLGEPFLDEPCLGEPFLVEPCLDEPFLVEPCLGEPFLDEPIE